MIYTPTNVQQKQSTKGTTYWRADLTDMNGQLFEGVAFFTPVRENESIDGFLESEIYNGKTSYKFKLTAAVSGGGKTAQIEKVMDKKNESISNFQDAKEKSIQHVASIRDATLLTVAMLEANIWPNKNEEMIKTKLRENIVFYKTLYSHPDDMSPSDNVPL